MPFPDLNRHGMEEKRDVQEALAIVRSAYDKLKHFSIKFAKRKLIPYS